MEEFLVDTANLFMSSSSSIGTCAGYGNGSNTSSSASAAIIKKKRNLPGNPDPSAEVISLSPTTLMSTNRFTCEICHKGFQRDQNLQLHRRAHNLPWNLKQRTEVDKQTRRRVYVCPQPSCAHHHPARALGDLTGIKKHFSRKHGEKKWKCERCSKKYAVRSDWKAHSKTCGTREYKCDCGTIFTRRDSFVTHRAFCDALVDDSVDNHLRTIPQFSEYERATTAPMSATALLQKAVQMGATPVNNVPSTVAPLAFLGGGDGFCFTAGDVGIDILGLTGVDGASTTVDFMGIGGQRSSKDMQGQRVMMTIQSLQQQQTTVSEQQQHQHQHQQHHKPTWYV